MEIKFDVYFKKNLGTLFKSNEVDLDGIPAHTNLDLNLVDRLEANYRVGTQKYTDNVSVFSIEERVIQIPFKSDVVRVGLNEFEIVAYMLNGDIKTSQTYTYNIDEAIGEGIVSGGGSGDGHYHTNLAILNSITQTKINEWNNKANKEHTHNANEIEGLDNIDIDLSSYYTKSETDNFISNKADKGHTHSEYLTEHQDISHKADKENTYTKSQTDNKIAEEIAKVQFVEPNNKNNNGLYFDNKNVVRNVLAFVDDTIAKQEYLGGYIEIQPDSWDGTPTATDSTTDTWGFPMSLLNSEQTKIKNDILHGNGSNIMYIRFPLGFAYRGYRNIDEVSKLAKNIGERFKGQNARLREFFKDISVNGGGLAPEYWCPPPHWLTSGSYHGDNQITAGGNYPRTTTLSSIKGTDTIQYNAQIQAFTDAIIDDLEYLHQNIAPVRMFGLQNEPIYSKMDYGACRYDAQTYNDVLEILYPKIKNSAILSEYMDEKNDIKLLVASSDESNPFDGIAKTFISKHSDWIWGYTHHSMREASGESSGMQVGADWYKTKSFEAIKGDKSNVFINEYEYFSNSFGTDEFRCSNNMLHLINESVYGEAKVLHPIIHICKPLGQTNYQTNTKGYCMYEVNLKDDYGIPILDSSNPYGLNKGTFRHNTWAYNSWALFGNNLPVGAYLVGKYDDKISNAGWCVYKYQGKLYVFMANNSNEDVSITLKFNSAKKFNGKMYSIEHCGEKIQSKFGSEIEFVIPAYSGQFWIETASSMIDIVPCLNLYLDKNNLSFNNYLSQSIIATKEPYNATESIKWASNPQGIVKVENGVITPVKNGQCVVSATCGDKVAICDVVVDIDNEVVLPPATLDYSQGYINDDNVLVLLDKNYTDNNYIAVNFNKIAVKTNMPVDNMRIAQYDANYNFIKRLYGNSKPFDGKKVEYFELEPTTKYVRVGFILLNNVNEEVLNNLFSSYTVEDGNIDGDTLALELGGINYLTGLNEDSNVKYRTGYLPILDMQFKIESSLLSQEEHFKKVGFAYRIYDSSKQFKRSSSSLITSDSIVDTADDEKYIRLVFAAAYGSDAPYISNGDTISINDKKYVVRIM